MAHRARSARHEPIWFFGQCFSSVGHFPTTGCSCYVRRIMTAPPPILMFIPVTLRPRNDGWSPELQLRFIELLAGGATPGGAAGRLGKNRQNAYALRRRPGAESFAAAWDSAVAWARSVRVEAQRGGSRVAKVEPPVAPDVARAIAKRGYREICSAGVRSPDRARRTFSAVLDALYGPKSDNSDAAEAGSRSPSDSELRALCRRSVAFRRAGLRRGPC